MDQIGCNSDSDELKEKGKTMYIELTETMFMDEFKSLRPDNFSNDGLRALYEYLTQLEDDTGTPIELDVIALCCEYAEDSIKDVLDNYSLDSVEELEDETLVIWQDDENVLYQIY